MGPAHACPRRLPALDAPHASAKLISTNDTDGPIAQLNAEANDLALP
jgi:hypothetical protein